MSYLNTTANLLLLNGTRIPLLIDQNLLDSYGFELSSDAFRIGDLRNYIFENWADLLDKYESNTAESTEDATAKPTTEEQIQLLHLGNRLDPNDLLDTLNFSISPVIHIIVKPLDQLQTATSSEKKRFDIKIPSARRKSGTNKRRGSTSNSPVPAFLPTTGLEKRRNHSVISTTDIEDPLDGSQYTQPLSLTHTEINQDEEITGDKMASHADFTVEDGLRSSDVNDSDIAVSDTANGATGTAATPTDLNRLGGQVTPAKEGGCCVIV